MHNIYRLNHEIDIYINSLLEIYWYNEGLPIDLTINSKPGTIKTCDVLCKIYPHQLFSTAFLYPLNKQNKTFNGYG